MSASAPLTLINAAADSGDCDYDYYRINRILWDDECTDVTTCSTDTGTSAITSVAGEDNVAKAFNYLVAKGILPAQAAGVVGNIQAESGFSPTRQETSQTFPNGGWGLVQWTGGRRSNGIVPYLKTRDGNLIDYYQAKYGGATDASTGYRHPDIPEEKNDALLLAEMDYVFKEMSSRKVNPDAILAKRGSAGQTELEALKSQESAENASDLWVYSFEHPTNKTGQAGLDAMAPTAKTRAGNAKDILTKYQKNAAGTDSTDACDDSATTGSDTGGDSTIDGTTRQKIVGIAKAELEKWNSGQLKPGSGYTKYLQGNGRTNWCAYFASWVYKTAGVPLTGGNGAVANVSTIKAIGQKGGKFKWHEAGTYTPKPGDLALYGFHINVVISANSGKDYKTIGGNEHGGENFNASRVYQNPGNYWPPLADGFVSVNE